MNTKLNKNLISSILPPLLSLPLAVVAYFASFFLTFIFSDDELSGNMTAFGVNISIYTLFKYLLFLIIFGSWYLFTNIRSIKDISGSVKKTRLKFLLLLIPAGYLIQLATTMILRGLVSINPDAFAKYLLKDGFFTGGTDIMVMLTVTFISPLVEEIMFRGLSMKYAEKAFDHLTDKAYIIAVILQAVYFGIFHLNMVQGIYAFIVGIVLGIIAKKTGSLFPGILLHSVINFSAYLIP